MTDLAALNDADLDALRLAVLLEQERRYLLDTAPARAAELATQYAQAIGRKDGDPYQPDPMTDLLLRLTSEIDRQRE